MCESVEGCTCQQIINTIEEALTTTSENFDYLISIINNSPEAQNALRDLSGLSLAYVTINATCGRPDRVNIHLKECWAEITKKQATKVLGYDDFCLNMKYKLTADMTEEELSRWRVLLGLVDCEVDIPFKALLVYEDIYHIVQLNDGTFELTIGSQIWTAESFKGSEFAELEYALHNLYVEEASHD